MTCCSTSFMMLPSFCSALLLVFFLRERKVVSLPLHYALKGRPEERRVSAQHHAFTELAGLFAYSHSSRSNACATAAPLLPRFTVSLCPRHVLLFSFPFIQRSISIRLSNCFILRHNMRCLMSIEVNRCVSLRTCDDLRVSQHTRIVVFQPQRCDRWILLCINLFGIPQEREVRRPVLFQRYREIHIVFIISAAHGYHL